LTAALFFGPATLFAESANTGKGKESPLSGLSIQVEPSVQFAVPECTVIEYDIYVTNHFTVAKEVNIQFGASQVHEAVEIADFIQSDPDVFELSLTITIPGGEEIHRKVSSVIRIPNNLYPCMGEVETWLSGQAMLTEDPSVISGTGIILVKTYKTCLLDGTQSPVYSSQLNLPLSPDALVIRGVFEVDNGSVFEFSSLNQSTYRIIAMAPGAVFRIAPKGECILTDVHVFGCCEMWQGFRNWGMLRMERVRLSDAEYGVETYHNSKISLKDSRFVNNFVGLHIPYQQPIHLIPQIQFLAFYGNEFSTEESLLLPPYQGQQALIEDLGFAGVWIHKMPDANLSGVKTPDFARYNTYKNLANGIISIQSNLIVKNSVYEDILDLGEGHPYPYSGRGIYSFTKLYNGLGKLVQEGLGEYENSDATFKNCTYGVYVEGTYASIRKNKMLLMETGVEIRHCLQKVLWVEDNWIEASRRGISAYQNFESGGAFAGNEIVVHSPEGPDDGAGIVFNNNMTGNGWDIANNQIMLSRALQGIAIRNTQYTPIRNNTIYLDLFGIGKERYIGISAEGAFASGIACNALYGNAVGNNYKLASAINLMGSPDSWVSCNEIDDTRFGIQAYGLCDGTQLKGNNWGNHWNGLLLGQYLSGGGYDGDAIMGPQSHLGNLWPQMQAQGANTTDDRYGAVHLSENDNVVSYSKFTVDEGENSTFLPEVGLLNLEGGTPEDWFFDEADPSTSYSCSTEITCPHGVGAELELTDLDYQIARSMIETEKFNDAQQWTANRHLYRRLLASPGLVQPNTAIDTFYTDAGQTSAGKHEESVRDVSTLFVLDSTQTLMLTALQTTITEGLQVIIVLDSLLADRLLSYQDSIAFTAQRQTWQDSLAELSALQDSLSQDWAGQWKQDAISLQFETGYLPDTAQYEENHRIVREILLDKLAEGYLALDSLETVQLEAIASQCPLSGGDAVFEARALLNKGVYDDAALCNGGGQSSSSKKLDKPKGNTEMLRAVPNPATNSFSLVFPKPVENGATAQILIFDQLGREMLNLSISGPAIIVEVEASAWPSGIYGCALVLESGELFTTFISIQKN
jgi:hypothetical protein